MSAAERDRAVANRNGFTLVEILMVMAIIGFMMALILGGALYARDASKRAKAKGDLEKLHFALQELRMDNGNYPTSLSVNCGFVTPGAIRVVTNDDPILKGWPIDPWDHMYIYAYQTSPIPGFAGSYVLYSQGPKDTTTDDDIYSGK